MHHAVRLHDAASWIFRCSCLHRILFNGGIRFPYSEFWLLYSGCYLHIQRRLRRLPAGTNLSSRFAGRIPKCAMRFASFYRSKTILWTFADSGLRRLITIPTPGGSERFFRREGDEKNYLAEGVGEIGRMGGRVWTGHRGNSVWSCVFQVQPLVPDKAARVACQDGDVHIRGAPYPYRLLNVPRRALMGVLSEPRHGTGGIRQLDR